MNLPKKVINIINLQIKHEFTNAQLYLNFSNILRDYKLFGLQNLFVRQSTDEKKHAHKFINYLKENDAKYIVYPVDLKEVQNLLEHNKLSVLKMLDKSLTREKETTKKINNINDVAVAENDESTKSFLIWFFKEQVKEEALFLDLIRDIRKTSDIKYNITKIDDNLKDDTSEWYMEDKEATESLDVVFSNECLYSI
jgi:ferritin